MRVFTNEKPEDVEPLTPEERQEIDSADFSWVWMYLQDHTVFDVPRMERQWANVKRALKFSDQQVRENERLKGLLKEHNIPF